MSNAHVTIRRAIVILVSCGCVSPKSTGRAYAGPALTRADVAVVAFDDSSRSASPQSVALRALDGTSAKMGPDRKIEVLPGQHRIRFLYAQGKSEGLIEFTFPVQAGHEYLITYDKKSNSERQSDRTFKLWVEDMATHAHVTVASISAD